MGSGGFDRDAGVRSTALAHVAETAASAPLTAIIDRLRRPVRVAVVGRDGVGRGSVATALRVTVWRSPPPVPPATSVSW